jgi:hypothetical protein
LHATSGRLLLSNAFIAWRIAERSDLLQSASSYETLDKFRHNINNVQPQSEFVWDIARELLTYADKVARLEEAQIRHLGATALTELEKIRLRNLAKNTKRRRLSFFNTQDGKRLRLDVPQHEQIQQQKSQWCALCSINRADNTAWRGHRSKYRCSICDVHLFLRTYTGFRKNCWCLCIPSSRFCGLSSGTPLHG